MSFQCQITNVPNPILLHMFSFLPSEAYGKIAQVCKNFYKLIWDPQEGEISNHKNYREFMSSAYIWFTSGKALSEGLFSNLLTAAIEDGVLTDKAREKCGKEMSQVITPYLNTFVERSRIEIMSSPLSNWQIFRLTKVQLIQLDPFFQKCAELLKPIGLKIMSLQNSVFSGMSREDAQKLKNAAQAAVNESKEEHKVACQTYNTKMQQVHQELLSKTTQIAAIPITPVPPATPVRPSWKMIAFSVGMITLTLMLWAYAANEIYQGYQAGVFTNNYQPRRF